jgi:apolipoprotein D and lipocalin family protein
MGSVALSWLVAGHALAVTPVDYVDLGRYAGLWYEVASIPQPFQRQCVGGVTATYTGLSNGRIEVINACDTADGSSSVITGEARVRDTESNAKLKVTFVNIRGRYVYLFGGAYWVIDLEPSYRYAVVGHPTAAFGWILARQPSLALEDLQGIADRLELQGYDTCEFMTTVQDGGFAIRQPLCEYLDSQR